MLQHEDITKVQKLKGKFDKVWVSSEYLQAHLNILGFNKIKRQFSCVLDPIILEYYSTFHNNLLRNSFVPHNELFILVPFFHRSNLS